MTPRAQAARVCIPPTSHQLTRHPLLNLPDSNSDNSNSDAAADESCTSTNASPLRSIYGRKRTAASLRPDSGMLSIIMPPP
mmetsp:Transcript_15622/g.43168  ORF Transcript_15622/g.43168 Transcript_15622/m.43168 type:complete len:81 (-) Transcript_15622:453-695(-)